MDDRLLIQDLPLAGLKRITRRAHSDHRGSFQRLYCQQVLGNHAVSEPLAQINLSLTRKKASIRGMHYQNPPLRRNQSRQLSPPAGWCKPKIMPRAKKFLPLITPILAPIPAPG